MSLYTVTSGQVTLTAGATKTLVLYNPSVNRVKVRYASIWLGGSAAAAGVEFDWVRATTLGAPAGTAATSTQCDEEDGPDQNGVPLATPATPAPTTATSGGTVAAGTYTVEVAYVGLTVSNVSASGTVTTSGSTSTITIPSPAPLTGASGWYAYVSQAGGTTLTQQQPAGSPTAIGTALTLTAPPTSTGSAPPPPGNHLVNLTTEPTTYVVVEPILLPPFGGGIKDWYPYGAEIATKAGGQRIGIRYTTAAGVSVPCTATLCVEV